jgi:hypothetical protein
MSSIRFADIQLILNTLIAGRDWQRILEAHGDPTFGWDTLEQLKGVVVRPNGDMSQSYPLIEQKLIDEKRGAETNLVKALRDAGGVGFNGRMPLSPPPGRYATPQEIQTIVDWLNAGAQE